MNRRGGLYRRRIVVHYPLRSGRLVVRSEHDMERDIEPVEANDGDNRFVFELECERPWIYFKPFIRVGDTAMPAKGANRLAILTGPGEYDHYPYFYSDEGGTFAPLFEMDSTILGRRHRAQIYLPAGYEENHLHHYPIVYMQDGRNLFFPEEAFLGKQWKVDKTVAALDAMNLIDKVIIVGIHNGQREEEYTYPGYESYGRSIVEELKPALEAGFRTLADPTQTLVMGSSLGGVASFFMAWQWPEVFQLAACMSSTFGFRDDLIDRVLAEPKRDIRVYLDSGWPEDNYEATLSMAMAMVSRGWILGRNLMHLVFPNARHEEAAWTARLPLPLQLFGGKLRMAWHNEQERIANGGHPPAETLR